MARLQKLLDRLHVDVTFLADGLVAAQDAYTRKFNASNTSQEVVEGSLLGEGRIQHTVAEAQCFIEKYETMKACLC